MASVIFYHYTRREFLPSILQTGLSRGDVPLTPTVGMIGPSLTKESDPARLVRAGVLYPEKARARLTVELDAGDSRLVSFVEIPRRFQHDPAFYRVLALGSNTREWFAYLGTVFPDRFRALRVDGQDLPESRWPAILSTWPRLPSAGVECLGVRVVTPEQAALTAPALAA